MVGRGGSSLEAHEVIGGGGAIVPRGTRVAVDVCRVGDDGATEHDDGEVLELADVLELQWVAHTQQRQFPLSRSHASTHTRGAARAPHAVLGLGLHGPAGAPSQTPTTAHTPCSGRYDAGAELVGLGLSNTHHFCCVYIRREPSSFPYFVFLLPFAPTRPSLASTLPFKMADLLSHVSTPSSGWRVNPPVSDIFTRMLILC